MCDKTDHSCTAPVQEGQLHVEIERRNGKIYRAHAAPDQQCYQHDPGKPTGWDIVTSYQGTHVTR